ncbi:MAG: hypothetical protein KKE02_12130 [Alphaproteobacteria bacterium]|nr:hypothetical protein [Alphaproteobacteria bacterium]MBU1514023.1 hypothetical protein [Alphaproteobacteria bacterium]MBU2093037.1 hypothetical protein [Alphaproteobacteria bacterium]MBU2151760.1 hypothetical protein [Alphaproteobacteria bacterium]MBU2309420.1 hypothetical protein [Alphaproteobacteria bacterium]
MATRFQPRRRPDRFSPARFAPRPVQTPQPRTLPLPPAAVVDAILRFRDVEVDQGGQRTLLRLSDRALREPQVVAALGGDTRRAANVAILWNERESEIIRVLEGSDARLAA